MNRVLLATAAVFVLLLFLEWKFRYEMPAPPALDLQPVDLATPAAPEGRDSLGGELQDREVYDQVAERTLFNEERRPEEEEEDEPEEVTEEAPPPSELDKLDLNAVLITPKNQIAWVRDPTEQKLLRLTKGKKLKGWTVNEIRSDRILLEGQGQEAEMVLRDYSKLPPPKARPTRANRLNRALARQARAKEAKAEAEKQGETPPQDDDKPKGSGVSFGGGAPNKRN